MTTDESANEARPYPQTYPLGWSTEPDGSDEPGRLPTLNEFVQIKRERCRHKLAATRVKALAAAVFAELGEASRPVLTANGITVEADGTVRSGAEEEIDHDWKEIVWRLHKVHGARLSLPCDTSIDPATGCVVVVPSSHEAHTHA